MFSDRPRLEFQVPAETDTETETLAETVTETETMRTFSKSVFSADFYPKLQTILKMGHILGIKCRSKTST